MYLSFYSVLQFIFWIRIIQTYVLPLDLGSLALNYLNQPFQHTRNMYETDTYEFYFNSGNKIARIEIGQNEELSLTDVLRAVQDILVAGGFTYVDEVRAVNYGERENKIFSSNLEDSMWKEENEVPIPEDDGFREVEHETVVLNTDDSATANVFENQY